MDMQEARDIAVRFLGGLPVTDNQVYEAGELIRKVFRQNGLADDDVHPQLPARAPPQTDSTASQDLSPCSGGSLSA